jgi:hypothetical protein
MALALCAVDGQHQPALAEDIRQPILVRNLSVPKGKTPDGTPVRRLGDEGAQWSFALGLQDQRALEFDGACEEQHSRHGLAELTTHGIRIGVGLQRRASGGVQ